MIKSEFEILGNIPSNQAVRLLREVMGTNSGVPQGRNAQSFP